MKKTIVFSLICILLLCAIFYGFDRITGQIETETFSYAKTEEAFLTGQSGGQDTGFNNTSPTSVRSKSKAIRIAKKEVNIDYNEITVYYDSTCGMWMVVFSLKDIHDACQAVYLDSNGITKLIVYGG